MRRCVAVGTMQLEYANSVGICVEDDGPSTSDGGDAAATAALARGGSGGRGAIDWRVVVGAAVGAAAFVALTALAAVLLWRSRQRRALLAKEEEAAKRQGGGAAPWQARPCGVCIAAQRPPQCTHSCLPSALLTTSVSTLHWLQLWWTGSS